MTIKEYIIDRLLGFDPTLDLSDNSALVDLLVNPGSAMLDPVIAQLNFLLTNLGLGNPETIDETEFDSIAANFLKSRIPGAKAVGVVELFYNNPVSLDIPQGTTFTSSAGLVFVTNKDIHIPLSSMAGNTWNYPRYSTGPIPVVAQDYGVIASIPPNDITSTNLVPPPALVTNPTAFSGGADKETNSDFAARVIDEVVTAALGSARGIRASLRPLYPTIKEIKVRGMNDIEMLRDLVYSGIQVYNNYQEVDYYGKVSGLNEPPWPQSLAYWHVFADSTLTSGLVDDLPSVADFFYQFTSTQYVGIWTLDDALKTTMQTQTILKDDFQDPVLNEEWVLSDSITGLGLMKDANEFTLTTVSGTQMLRLGNRLSISDIDARSIVTMGQQELYNILTAFAYGNYGVMQNWLEKYGVTIKQVEDYNDLLAFLQSTSTVDESQLSPEERQLWNLMINVAGAGQVEKTHNFYPLATRYLAKHAGIIMTGRFMTDDTSEEGVLSYVTVLRDEDSIDPTNGFGFAWMRNDAANSIYNVYIVDNSPLANDLFISPTSIILPQGENPFRAAAKMDIKADRIYRYKVVIGGDYSMLVKIWPDGEAEPSDADTAHVVNAGAPLNVSANGLHVGFGVMGTQNGQWFYDDLQIDNYDGVHTALLYRLKADPAEFPNGTYARVNHYGYGYDSVTYGLTAFIKEYVAGEWTWTEIGSNTSTNVSDRDVAKISHTFLMGTNFRDTDNFIDVLVTSTTAITDVTEVTSYYVNLESGIPSGVHTGGCADIYINDPASVLIAEQTLNNVTGNILLNNSNGFVGPIHSIVEVQTAFIGESLIENSDWTLITTNPATAMSTQEYPFLMFSPDLLNTKVRVIYRYYAYGSEIQTRLDSDDYRYSGTSNLVKIMPPVLVRVNSLNFRGPITAAQIQTAIMDYVHNQTVRIRRNEIINAVYTAGASFVDLTALDIEIIETNYLRETQDPIQLTDEYVKPILSAFFTDSYELNGVIKL